MKVTLSEWLELAALAKKAHEALTALEDRLIDLSWEHHRQGNNPESVLLRGLADEVANTELHSGHFQPQSEWMGGPSTGPNALPTFLREPHCVGSTGRHFTQEEVEEAKRRGQLKGHYGGPASKPEPRNRDRDAHLYKFVQEEWREDHDIWKYMGDVPTEGIAQHNVLTAGENGHDYAYLAW